MAPEFSDMPVVGSQWAGGKGDKTRTWFPWEVNNTDYVRRALEVVQDILKRMYKEAVRAMGRRVRVRVGQARNTSIQLRVGRVGASPSARTDFRVLPVLSCPCAAGGGGRHLPDASLSFRTHRAQRLRVPPLRQAVEVSRLLSDPSSLQPQPPPLDNTFINRAACDWEC